VSVNVPQDFIAQRVPLRLVTINVHLGFMAPHRGFQILIVQVHVKLDISVPWELRNSLPAAQRHFIVPLALNSLLKLNLVILQYPWMCRVRIDTEWKNVLREAPVLRE